MPTQNGWLRQPPIAGARPPANDPMRPLAETEERPPSSLPSDAMDRSSEERNEICEENFRPSWRLPIAAEVQLLDLPGAPARSRVEETQCRPIKGVSNG